VTVVTGMGTVSAAGLGKARLLAALRSGTPTMAHIDRSDGMHHRTSARLAACVEPEALRGAAAPTDARRMSNPSRFALLAACEALEDAGLPIPTEPDGERAVVVATAFGHTAFTQQMFDQILDLGPTLASPMLFSESVANAAAARVALATRAAGPNLTLAQGEAGPLLAVARGLAEIEAGRARTVLAGAADEMNPLVHAILDRFRALARARGDQPERARPFERRRNGFLAAEGASLLLLESEAAATARGATPIARILGAWSAFDPSAPPSGWGNGVDRLAARLRRGLTRFGRSPGDVDAIISGASGSRAGDRLEALVLRQAWGGQPLPPILAPKETTGEYGGAFLAAAVLAASGERWGSASDSVDVDPELGVGMSTLPLPATARCFLVTTLAAGGPASWLLLERP